MKLLQALAFRNAILNAAKELIDDTALTVKWMYMEWEINKAYVIGDRVRYGEKLYKCIQAHTSTDTYTPGEAVSLWAEVLPGQDGDIGEWVQPDSTNPYMMGDKVTHNNKRWISRIDYNVYEPGVAGWEEF